MRYYFIAFLIWIIKILLWISLIGIPVERYMSDKYSAFSEPFYWAYASDRF